MTAGSQTGSRLAVQVGLFAVAALTHRDTATLALVLPVFLCASAAAVRNTNPEVDAIDVFWFLVSLFFVVRPAQILEHGSLTLYMARAPLHYSDDIVLVTFAAIYIFVLAMFVLLPRSGRALRQVDFQPHTALLPLFAAIGFGIVAMASGDMQNLFAARYDKQMDQISPLVTLGQGLLIAATTMQVAAFVATPDRKATDFVRLGICLVLLAVVFNPLNAARFGLVAAWLPIALIVVPAIRRPLVFATLSLSGIVVVMPILSLTTRFGLDFERAASSGSEASSLLQIPYIDTFDSLMHGVYYAHTFGFQFGAKVLAILLCFVPRSVWPEKPLVSGLDIGNHLHAMGIMGTPNLSMPIVGDFYMDFGLAGVALGSIAVALLFRALLVRQPSIHGIPVFGYLVIGALPIVVRGAVGAVVLLAACTLISYAILALVLRAPQGEPQRVPS